MPELPEVDAARRQLSPAMTGARIERVLARRQVLRYPLPDDFRARLEGQRVRAVSRRAKHLIVELASGALLVMHLGMSGSFRLVRAPRGRNGVRHDPAGLEPHDHVIFMMSSGVAVVFNDPRRFGSMTVLDAEAVAAHPTLGTLGVEPLNPGFTALTLVTALGRRTTAIKVALLDQRIVAGLGNIYACEALHRAGLSPRRRASTLTGRDRMPTPQAKALVVAIRHVLRIAIAGSRAGGADRFRVYDREGLTCLRRGCSGSIRRIVQAGRSTFFCPVCQR